MMPNAKPYLFMRTDVEVGPPRLADDGVHITRYDDLADLAREERAGRITSDAGALLAVFRNAGIPVPDQISPIFYFPWAMGGETHRAAREFLHTHLRSLPIYHTKPLNTFEETVSTKNRGDNGVTYSDHHLVTVAEYAHHVASRVSMALLHPEGTVDPELETQLIMAVDEMSSRENAVAMLAPPPDQTYRILDRYLDEAPEGSLGATIAVQRDWSIDVRQGLVAGLIAAGSHTTANLISQSIALAVGTNWLGHATPDAIVTEAERWSPFPVSPRVTTDVVEFGAYAYPAGVPIHVHWHAINRDPARWTRPEWFDPNRAPQTNAAYGYGLHTCLGKYVAREVAIRTLSKFDNRYGHKRPKLRSYKRVEGFADPIVRADVEFQP